MREEDCVVGAGVICIHECDHKGKTGTIRRYEQNYYYDESPCIFVLFDGAQKETRFSFLSSLELFAARKSFPETLPCIPVSSPSPKVYQGQCPCGLMKCEYHTVVA